MSETNTLSSESDYSEKPVQAPRITRELDGFIIEKGDLYDEVMVHLLDTCWQVTLPAEDGTGVVSRYFGLFCIYDLVNYIVENRLRRWRPAFGRIPARKIYAWKRQKTRCWVSKLIAQERQRLFAQIDPMVLAVQQKSFAANCSTHRIFFDPRFYGKENQYLLDDIQRYRAAAMAANCFTFLIDDEESEGSRCEAKDELNQPRLESLCEKLRSWRTLFSDTGKTYRALNQTLDHLPGNLSPYVVSQLRFTHLSRAYSDRAELVLFLLTSPQSQYEDRAVNERIFRDAQRQEIQRAMALVGRALQTELSLRRTADISTMATYLKDYPEVHNGRLVGLAEASIRYHRELAENRVREYTAADRPVAAPPIPLPEVEGLRFLGTTNEIIAEGAKMGHCIARYARSALEGNSFLFHYDYKDEMASIEVDRSGHVRQSFGPRNLTNRASEKARHLLTHWARNFPPLSNHLPSYDDVPF
ncbi:MAG: PcfJ-like protein [Planctomycetota bacterium]|jgi:hypothetical protein